ncbi:MAG TPA: hypothetical protein VFR78_14915 [Pyrinomonadaceae bacterium]|nr:hypothetical protein [Pyrinomonadaceae bacterium]
MPKAAKQPRKQKPDAVKMMDGHDNLRFPGPGIDLIHHDVAVNLFQVVDGEEVLLESLIFNGRMLIERGRAYKNADGFRQIDFIALSWTATAWSKSLKQDILYILSQDVEQPISNIIAETKDSDFPATIQFDLIFDVRLNNQTIIRQHRGRPKGHKFLTIPPAADTRTELAPTVSLFGADDIMDVGVGADETGEVTITHNPPAGFLKQGGMIQLRVLPVDCNDKAGTTLVSFAELNLPATIQAPGRLFNQIPVTRNQRLKKRK